MPSQARPALFLLTAGLLLTAAPAGANGAFPGEMGIMLPSDNAQHMFVASNFGLLASEDAGAHWYYACEAAISPHGGNVLHYEISADDSVLAVAVNGYSHTEDDALTWISGAGTIDSVQLSDGFPDPNDSSFVVVIGTAPGGKSALYPSSDGGLTFGPPLLTEDGQLLTVELSRSTPGLMYATALDTIGSTSQSFVLQSPDRGMTWVRHAITSMPASAPRLAAIDAADGQTLYLRMTPPTGSDLLAISTDGGATVTAAAGLSLGGTMGAFTRGPDGTLYVGASTSGDLASSGGLWVQAPGSSDWNMTTTMPITCLGFRGSTLYACSSGVGANFALGSSVDRGATFTPIFFFSDIGGPIPCTGVESTCTLPWETLRGEDGFIGDQPPSGGPYFTCPATATHSAGCRCGAGDSAPWSAMLPLLVGRRRRVGARSRARTSEAARG